ncbi:MAG: asparagine synthase (glutamine-hydrolyzing) [Deltaproteobacteria bacterium]|nr:asparagine synthase (glutamine-hydrolyzing) [Deltaproteobacteria bacterium]
MCGIAGIFNLHEDREISAGTMARMLSVLKHRGPDEFGMYRDGRAALGHARLSIIDLSGGSQPMCNEDKTVWITFNGEIFNFIELREELIGRGHRFRTHSDTEVIIHLYEDHGPGCLDYLNGQFAFAIWDKKSRELFLARDRMGIRPLFYAMNAGRFYFASEIKGIFAAGEIKREIDPAGIDEIFTMWCNVAPRTAFKDVYELPPACYLTIKNGVVSRTQYWDLVFPEKPEEIGFEDAVEELKRLLVDSARLRLRADVPVGAYLSGGLDSSVTTALIRNFSNSPLKTFSVAFEDKDYDESSYQNEMAKALGTEHHEVRCSYSDISRNFPDVIWHTEKPVLRTAPVPLYLLSRLVRDSNFKVVLTGEGADEVLGGYDIFKETKIRQFWARFPESQTRPLLLKRLYPYLPAFQGQSKAYMEAFFNGGLSDTRDAFFSHRPRWQTTSKNKLFFSDALKEAANGSTPEDAFRMCLTPGFENLPPLSKAQYIESKNLLPGYILSSQGDRVSMANSIEGRFPFLDYRVVEFCAKLPPHYKIKGLNEKYILKKCMSRYLPERIVKRSKQPYLAPDGKSFFNDGKPADYVEELLSESCLGEYGYFKPGPVRLLFNKFLKGGAIGFKDNMALVGILSTQLLHYRFIKNFNCDVTIKDIKVAG